MALRPATWRFTRRASRLAKYLLIAVAVALIAQWSRSCDPSAASAASNLRRRARNVDFAWGSLLHRFQNHPRPSPAREALPWKLSKHSGARPELTRTLIVTSELAGLHKNGGIGTAYSELAAALAATGDIQVTVLVAHEAKAFPIKQRQALEAR